MREGMHLGMTTLMCALTDGSDSSARLTLRSRAGRSIGKALLRSRAPRRSLWGKRKSVQHPRGAFTRGKARLSDAVYPVLIAEALLILLTTLRLGSSPL